MSINDRIKTTLEAIPIAGMPELIRKMEREVIKADRGNYFQARSGGHDHWTNGTAQHSWRVYQYMLYLHSHPEKVFKKEDTGDHSAQIAELRQLPEWCIALAGLLHDWGNINGKTNHEIESEQLICGFSNQGRLLKPTPEQQALFEQTMAAIYLHHHSEKWHRVYSKYRGSMLLKMLQRADGMASGTTWNSFRFANHHSQWAGHYGKTYQNMLHPQHEAMDRTHQALSYGIYLDYHYNLQEIARYGSGQIEYPEREVTGEVHIVHVGNLCRAKNTRTPWGISDEMRDLLIRSNVSDALFRSASERDAQQSDHRHKYVYTLREELSGRLSAALHGHGALLRNVTFFRDTEAEGFRFIAPEQHDVLLVE